jgi:hypothetical protein
MQGRLKRDQQIEAGLRVDHRNDAESAFRRQADPASDPDLAMYRRGWALVGVGLTIFIATLLGERLLDPIMDRGGDGQLIVYGVLAIAGLLVCLGSSTLQRYKTRKD